MKWIIPISFVYITFTADIGSICMIKTEGFIGAFPMIDYITTFTNNYWLVAKNFLLTTWTLLPIYAEIYGAHHD